MGVVVITGTNRGIGLELARQSAAAGNTVVATCRTASPELTQLGVEVVEQVEMSSSKGLEPLVAAVGDRAVDELICNAGILRSESLEALDYAVMLEQFEVNALGPLRTVSALLPRFASGSKIGLVTSRVGSIEDNGSGGMYGYRMSKAALNMAGMNLRRDLEPRGIAVALLHPGFVKTDMTQGTGNLTPTESARGLLARMAELSMQSTGTFWHTDGTVLPW